MSKRPTIQMNGWSWSFFVLLTLIAVHRVWPDLLPDLARSVLVPIFKVFPALPSVFGG